MEGYSKGQLPGVVARVVDEVGLSEADFPDLALRIVLSGAVTPQAGGGGPNPIPNISEWFLLNPGVSGGVRFSFNALNPLALVQAVLLSSSGSISIVFYISLILALFSAFGATITRDQAALFIALKQLEREGRARNVSAVAGRMTILLERQFSIKSVDEVVNQLRGIGVIFSADGSNGAEIVCEEESVFLLQQGA
jgi:hypothetical protein